MDGDHFYTKKARFVAICGQMFLRYYIARSVWIGVELTRIHFSTTIGDNEMQLSKFGALIVAAGAALAGCSSTPVAPPLAKPAPTSSASATLAPAPASTSQASATPQRATAPTPSGAAKPVPSSNAGTASLLPHLDPTSPISTERSVYFDFDDYAISRSDAKWLIEVHGKYLISKPSLAIKIEGNADERGSAEYNLALGQKRAQAVVQALKVFGVDEGRMEAVSWGKERPKATGHDEAAWSENRRADLVYPKQ